VKSNHGALFCTLTPSAPTLAMHLGYGGWGVTNRGITKDSAESMPTTEGERVNHLQFCAEMLDDLSKTRWETRNGVLNVVIFGSAGLYTRSTTIGQRRMMHVVGLFSPTVE